MISYKLIRAIDAAVYANPKVPVEETVKKFGVSVEEFLEAKEKYELKRIYRELVKLG